VYRGGLYKELPTSTQLTGSDGRRNRIIHAVKILGWGSTYTLELNEMPVQILGMAHSGNVIPPSLLVMDLGCGEFVYMSVKDGSNHKEDKLAINPWGQMPMMLDDGFGLGESNAILRYIANKYAPTMYGDADLKIKARIDHALDWCSTNWSKHYLGIWYVTAGFVPAPADQQGHNIDATKNLQKFSDHFLKDTKFVAGDGLSIADYKIAVQLWYCSHPAIKVKTGFELSERLKEYVSDFLSLSKSSAAFLDTATGFLNTKM